MAAHGEWVTEHERLQIDNAGVLWSKTGRDAVVVVVYDGGDVRHVHSTIRTRCDHEGIPGKG